jgi:hypothetical protein
MDRLSVLNAAGVAATVLLALAAAALAAVAAASGQAHAVPMLPQWDMLGATRGQQWEALAEVLPVILACFVAHQSLHPLMPLLRPYSPNRMLQVSLGEAGGVSVLSRASVEWLRYYVGGRQTRTAVCN